MMCLGATKSSIPLIVDQIHESLNYYLRDNCPLKTLSNEKQILKLSFTVQNVLNSSTVGDIKSKVCKYSLIPTFIRKNSYGFVLSRSLIIIHNCDLMMMMIYDDVATSGHE